MMARWWTRRLLSAALLAAGLALLIGLIAEIGAAPFVDNLDRLLLIVPIALLIDAVGHGFNALGWRAALGPDAARCSFGRAFAVWSAGDLVNFATPGTVGGEALRAWLIRDRVPLHRGVAAVTVARLAQTIAMVVFVALGVAIVWNRLDASAAERAVLAAVVAGAVVFVALSYWLQRTKMFGHAVGALRAIGLRGRWIDRMHDATARVDDRMRTFHLESQRGFWLSTALFFVGYATQAVEVPIILAGLQQTIDVQAVLGVQSLAALVEAVSFIVPGKVGIEEGGRTWIFTTLGYPAAIGLGFSLFRRCRELLWFAGSLAVGLILKRRVDQAVAARATARASEPLVTAR